MVSQVNVCRFIDLSVLLCVVAYEVFWAFKSLALWVYCTCYAEGESL